MQMELRENVNGMYILKTLDKPQHIPLALNSLSHMMSLEQWHRRLAHCSPSTIQEMANKNMVNGLKISDSNLNGKCKNCIMGHQTHQPFDGETEKDLELLDLVSFDLWGLSHTQLAGGKTYLMVIVDAGSSYKHGEYLVDKSDPTMIAALKLSILKQRQLQARKLIDFALMEPLTLLPGRNTVRRRDSFTNLPPIFILPEWIG